MLRAICMGATLLDDAGQVLRPCMLWNDSRAYNEAATLDAIPGFREVSGNIVFPGFTAPKVLWLAEHEPDVFSKIAKVLLPKDYLNYWLTGQYTSDMSDSAGTAWLDTGARDWSADLLSHSDMRRDQMPDLVEGSNAVGPPAPRNSRRVGGLNRCNRGGGRWRQRSCSLRRRSVARRRCLCISGHVRGFTSRKRHLFANASLRSSYILPRCAKPVVPNGGYLGRNRQLKLACA